MPEDMDRTAVRTFKPDDGVEQDRLARARAADDPKDLAAFNGKIQVLVNDPAPELRTQAPDLDGRGFGFAPEGLRSGHRSSSM
jgi:hypothetical protein